MQKSTAEITRIVEETVQGLGYEFVDFERLPRGLMRITIDSQAEGGVGVDDCETVSNQITALFTVEGIDYERLEGAKPRSSVLPNGAALSVARRTSNFMNR